MCRRGVEKEWGEGGPIERGEEKETKRKRRKAIKKIKKKNNKGSPQRKAGGALIRVGILGPSKEARRERGALSLDLMDDLAAEEVLEDARADVGKHSRRVRVRESSRPLCAQRN